MNESESTEANPPSPTKERSGHESGTSGLGMTLFLIYSLLYLGFVLLNTFMADAMELVVVAGLNLAIVYGFGLILIAILLAVIYGFALRNTSDAGDQR